MVAGDEHDPDALAKVLRGHDAVIRAVRFLDQDPENILGAIKAAGVSRFLCVGGAAGLYLPGTKQKLIDSGLIPAEYLPEPTAGVAFLERLRREEDLAWTFLAPSAMSFSNDPVYGSGKAERTGTFRIGEDELLVMANGKSSISYEDYAIALVDELEQPRHIRRRFTVGY
jgi:putative NADH-flavin reductase